MGVITAARNNQTEARVLGESGSSKLSESSLHGDGLLDTFEGFDDTDQDGVADESEYGESLQFLGGAPRGTAEIQTGSHAMATPAPLPPR